VVVERAERQLPKFVAARRPAGRLASTLHGGKEEADEGGDDRDHHQEFHEREAAGILSKRE